MNQAPTPSASVKQRLNYIDVAKGILILMVIYNHTGNLAVASGIHNSVIDFIPETRFFHSFFMPAFFVIAGMCSNYNKDFKSFCISNAKALLIPAVTLLFVRILVRYIFTGTFSNLEWNAICSKVAIFNLGYYNWFLTALFTTKVMFYAILHAIKDYRLRIIVLTGIHVLGVIIFNFKGNGAIFYNFYFYQHALMFLLYIEIGYEISKNNINSWGFKINTLIFFVFYVSYLLLSREIPSITSDPYVPIFDIIPHLFMSVCGSLMLIELSKIINKNSMEEFGKHSLVIYCLHFQFMFSYYHIFRDQLNTMGTHHTITALLILYVFTSLGCLLCSKLLNFRYIRWILGKF